ncbi:hypothetical protein MKY30_11980 [Oceanobacillus sp. FSL W8-0428]|uniref:hypothetical protein n=1 Tax=Oceanobacillus sp. FSL W8-0428 TaxID=2921715 RepID=UPI0030F6C03C
MLNIIKSYVYLFLGVIAGIMIVSVLRNGEINWGLIGSITALAVLGFFAVLFIRKGIEGEKS